MLDYVELNFTYYGLRHFKNELERLEFLFDYTGNTQSRLQLSKKKKLARRKEEKANPRIKKTKKPQVLTLMARLSQMLIVQFSGGFKFIFNLWNFLLLGACIHSGNSTLSLFI